MFVIGLIVGLIVGGGLGTLMTAICAAAKGGETPDEYNNLHL